MCDMKRPKSKQKKIPVRALTIDEQIKLLHILKTEDILYSEIMLLSMFTCMRIGECLMMNKSRLNRRISKQIILV